MEHLTTTSVFNYMQQNGVDADIGVFIGDTPGDEMEWAYEVAADIAGAYYRIGEKAMDDYVELAKQYKSKEDIEKAAEQTLYPVLVKCLVHNDRKKFNEEIFTMVKPKEEPYA